MICGEVGAGKTVAARAASSALDTQPLHDHLPAATRRSVPAALYTQIVTALGGDAARFTTRALIPQATELLAAEHVERGKTVVLVLDEAHLLGRRPTRRAADADQRRTWTQAPPSPCLLLGQPTLRRQLRLGAFAALDQRIALRCTTRRHGPHRDRRLHRPSPQLAGRADTLFSDDAVALIHEASRGLPRADQQPRHPVADRRLAAENKSICDERAAHAAVAEVAAE